MNYSLFIISYKVAGVINVLAGSLNKGTGVINIMTGSSYNLAGAINILAGGVN